MMEKTLIHHISNFTATGYRSELFNEFAKSTPYDADMGRVEVDEYL